MRLATLRAAMPAILLAALVLLPLHDKAFTVDDTFFLKGAVHAAGDPLHPTAYDIVWTDAPEHVGATGGLLMDWLLIPAVTSSAPESVAHLLELALFALAIVATVSLSRRLGSSPGGAMVAGLLLAATPAALAMAGTAMADIPAMALGVIGLERLVAWRQERRFHQATLAALALGLGPLARPNAVLLLGIGALFLLDEPLAPASWLRSGWTRWLPLPAAVLVCGGILALTWDGSPGAPGLFGVVHRLSAPNHMAPNAVAYFTHWGLALPLTIPWLLLRPGPVLRRWWLLPIAACALYALQLASGRASVAVAAVAALGVAVLWDILADGWLRRDGAQLVLGLWLFLPLASLSYAHLPAKFHLAAAPGAAILVARQAAATTWRTRLTLGLTSVAAVVLGVAILRADGAFADLGRKAAATLIAPHVKAGTRVWFTGHWGFQWYAERAGARPVTITPPYPEPGDLIVASRNCAQGPQVFRMLREAYRVSPVARVEETRPGGRVMTEGAGFFANTAGYLPWIWGEQPLESISLWQVVAHRPLVFEATP